MLEKDKTNKDTASIAIVGVYPPPYGGVSIHIKRLLPYIEEAGLSAVFYNTGPVASNNSKVRDVGRSPLKLFFALIRKKHKLVHFHTSRWPVRFMGGVINFFVGSEIVFTCHGVSVLNSVRSYSPIVRALSKWALSRSKAIIATNEYIKEGLIQAGVISSKIEVIPAFIPPVEMGTEEDIPIEVRDFCQNKRPILVANGAFVTIDGKDVYGLRLMLNVVRVLIKDFPELALVVYMRAGADSEKDKFADVIEYAITHPLKNNVLLFPSKGEFCSVFSIADIFLRLTTSDGDSNTVREALYFGIPVIASDVIPRPCDCIVYSHEKEERVAGLIATVIRNLDKEKKKLSDIASCNGAELLIEKYRQLLAE